MSFERPIGPGAEPAAVSAATSHSPRGEGTATEAMRLQILSTEHWSLLASRSLAWNEMFSRAGMFLSSLSGAIVALALVAQATGFGEGFRIFAFAVLPVVLFIGVSTLFRMGSTNYHDAQCVIGMNRIRAGYLEMAPDLERFFVMGMTDDDAGIGKTMAFEPSSPRIVQFIAGSPILVIVINAVLLAAIVALLAIHLGANTPMAMIVGAAGFLVMLAVEMEFGRRGIKATIAAHRADTRFPGSSADQSSS